MGGIFSMQDTMKKNQEAMQRIEMERQIQMQYQMQQRQVALLIAQKRDFCLWFGTFYILTTVGLVAGFRKTKNPALLVSLVPLTLFTLYNVDAAYGNKMHRIRMEAEHIMAHETDYLQLPAGLPTVSSIDLGRQEAIEQTKIHPPIIS